MRAPHAKPPNPPVSLEAIDSQIATLWMQWHTSPLDSGDALQRIDRLLEQRHAITREMGELLNRQQDIARVSEWGSADIGT